MIGTNGPKRNASRTKLIKIVLLAMISMIKAGRYEYENSVCVLQPFY